jgi:hypothetical protein
MTDTDKNRRRLERQAQIERIFDLALGLAEQRLSAVDAKEKADNIAFDRVARTAQVFIRAAGDAAALETIHGKEDAPHDEGAKRLDETQRELDEIERRLRERIPRPAPAAQRRDAAGLDGAAAGGRS